MKQILILMLVLVMNQLHAQKIWQDFIIGKPMANITEARATVAKDWGINYKAILAGCEMNDEVAKKAEEYNKQNEAYLTEIAEKYGANWMEHFTFETKVQMLRMNNPLPGKWIDPVPGRPDIQYFEAKKKLAESWGIPYLAYFLNCSPSNVSKEQQAEIDKGSTYLRQLTSMLGDDWQKRFDRELLKIREQKQHSIGETWNEYLLEKVDEAYYNKKKEVLATWGITYQPYFVHCCKGKEKKMKEGGYADKEKEVKKLISDHYGEGWEEHLHIEVVKALNKK